MPQRIQLSRRKGSNLQSESIAFNGCPAVKVDRTTYWGNPFNMLMRSESLKLFADTARGYWTPDNIAEYGDDLAREVYKAHCAWLARLNHHPSESIRSTLRGFNLACWCALDQPCHADILLKIANGET